jgi:DNA-binding SARP family transcriptional activator
MSGAFAAVVRLLRALVALAVLGGFTAGVPWLLAVVAGWPLDWIGWPQLSAVPGLTEVYTTITNPLSDQMILALLASIGWVLWLQFIRDTVIEVIEASAAASAARQGRPRTAVGGRGPIRWVAAVLVGAIAGAVLFDLARSTTDGDPAHARATLAGRPTATVTAPAASAVPAVLRAPHHVGARPAIHLPAPSPAAVTVVSTAAAATVHADPDVPAWARDAPGGVHPVVAGDNLWDIAQKRLSDPHRWREIYTLNRGHPQANSYALTDPDEIHVGWVLALPARDAAPAAPTESTPPAPTPPDPAPTNPAPTGPAATDPAPGGGQSGPSTVPSTPPASAPTPGTLTPSAPAGGDSPDGSASAPDAEQQPGDSRDEAGISLPASGWVSLGLAAAIASVAAMLRLQRRRRARLSFPVAVSTAPQPAPVPESLAVVDAVGSRHLDADTDGHRPAAPPVAAPVGVDVDGAEVSLFDLPGPGIALHGDGATPAARAILAAALSTGAVQATVEVRPVVVTTADLLARLLPERAALVGLDPDGTSFDGERLIVLADTAAAVTHAEEEMIGRRRLLDAFDVETVTDLNARTDHAEAQPPYVLLIEATTRHAGRLGAVAVHAAALDLHPVIVGGLDGIPTLQVDADGTVTADEATGPARLATLAAGDLAAVLAMLTDAVARPEPGNDVDDPASQTPSTAAPTEPAEPVPAQQRETPALVRLRVLGPVTVATDAGPVATGMRSGSYAALALLAAHPAGRTLDQLAADLHPNTAPTTAAKRVRTDTTAARRVLREATGHSEPMFIVYNPATGRYRLDPEVMAVDLWQMLTAIEQANTADDDTQALTALREAAELYGADFADGQDRAWVTDYAATYRHQILAVHARIAEILEPDHPDQAVAALEKAVELDPVNEELYQRIMRIHGRAHRPDAVRRTLRRLEERLAALGDAEPSQATRRVAERQLRPATLSAGPT